MSDLYERYKEALRTGHVAVLRGFLEAAVEAYEAAAAIAPTRALPHTSLGGVYLRMERLGDALAEYAAAVARAPLDEGALLGQAEALTAVGRLADAASALDRVAQLQEKAARLPEAADTLRRALELDDSPERVRRQRSLLREIRLSAGDRDAENALARALRLPDATTPNRAMAETAPVAAPPAAGLARGPEGEAATEPAESPIAAVPIEPEPAITAAIEASARAEAEAEPVAAAAAGFEALVEPVTELSVAAADDARLEGEAVLAAAAVEPAGPSASDLLAASEEADARGDAGEARRLLIDAARGYAREGRFDAGLDTAHRVVLHHPGDVDGHLVLVELYMSRGWEALATDKLVLLGRIAELTDDAAARMRVCAAAAAAFPGNMRLASLCA